MIKKLVAEYIGTFWLVFGGCGSSLMFSVQPESQIGILAVALAFGIAFLSMAYTIGHISGCHLNPAVSIGFCFAGRFDSKELLPYICSQVIGAVSAGYVIYLLSCHAHLDLAATAANGFGIHSPANYDLATVFLIETLMSLFLMMVILGSTDHRAPKGFAPISIGLAITLIHLVTIPISNTSINPARSTGIAIFAGNWALDQLWVFWVAPILGACFAGMLYFVFCLKAL